MVIGVLICKGERDSQTAKTILFKSIYKFAMPKLPILVICPDSDYKLYWKSYPLWKDAKVPKVSIMKESKLMRFSFKKKHTGIHGYQLQMLLKILIGKYFFDRRICNQYVTLDADVLLKSPTWCLPVKPSSVKMMSLFDDAMRARVTMENAKGHYAWWKEVADLYEIKIHPTERVCGVTPMIMYSHICHAICSKFGENLYDIMTEFTEYTMYWCFLLKYKKYEIQKMYNTELPLYGKSIWSFKDMQNIDQLLTCKRTPFIVIQSTLNLNMAQLKQRINKILY